MRFQHTQECNIHKSCLVDRVAWFEPLNPAMPKAIRSDFPFTWAQEVHYCFIHWSLDSVPGNGQNLHSCIAASWTLQWLAPKSHHSLSYTLNFSALHRFSSLPGVWQISLCFCTRRPSGLWLGAKPWEVAWATVWGSQHSSFSLLIVDTCPWLSQLEGFFRLVLELQLEWCDSGTDVAISPLQSLGPV